MSPRVRVEHLGGARRGQVQILTRLPARFGRHPECDVAFDPRVDIDASARHAELRPGAGGVVLMDLASSNGTLVEGRRVTAYTVPDDVAVEVEFGAGGPRCRITVEARRPEAGLGQTTVRRMLDHAMAEASKHRGLGRSTTFVRLMVDQALRRSTRRFKVILIVVGILFGGGVSGLLVWSAKNRREAAAQQEEMTNRLEEQRRQMEIERLATEQALAEGPGPRIVRENKRAVFLLAAAEPSGERAFCTAFAVAPVHLATNAHCVAEINRVRAAGHKVYAIRNGAPTDRYGVVSVVRHPGFVDRADRISTDVGLVEVGRSLEATVRLADGNQLQRLEAGLKMYTYGFPGRLADPARPEATLTEGVIGRVTRLGGERGRFEENRLVQHDAFAAGGTSGSPVFDATGAVIAVNAGGYVGQQKQVFFDPETRATRVVDVGAPLAGYNVAIRIDALTELMERHGVTVRPGREP